MNYPGAYDDVEMNGLPAALYEDVDVEGQKKLIAAFPDLRMIWNAKLGLYQTVTRDPDSNQTMHSKEGLRIMQGWFVIPGNFPPPLDWDDMIQKRQMQHYMATEKCHELGFESMAAYADFLSQQAIDKIAEEQNAAANDVLGIVNEETGKMSHFRPGVARSKPSVAAAITKEHLGVTAAPSWLERAASPVNRAIGDKLRAERAVRKISTAKINAALREGAPL